MRRSAGWTLLGCIAAIFGAIYLALGGPLAREGARSARGDRAGGR